MSLTRAQLVARVLDTMSRALTGTSRSGVTYETMAIDWLNFAQDRIARREDILFRTKTGSTVASQKCYSYPSESRTLYSLVLQSGSNSRSLTLVMPEKMEKIIPYPENETTGLPTWYIPQRNGTEFHLFKVPDSSSYTLLINYSHWPTPLTSSSQESDYDHMDDILIAGAVSEGYFFIQESGDGAVWEKIFDKRLAEHMNTFDNYPDWYPKGEGFCAISSHPPPPGTYYSDPLAFTNPGGYSWQ